jgi:hypothetical protein
MNGEAPRTEDRLISIDGHRPYGPWRLNGRRLRERFNWWSRVNTDFRLRCDRGCAGLGSGRGNFCILRGSSNMVPQFEQFAMQRIILLRGDVDKLFELAAKFVLPPYRIDSEGRRGQD